MESADLIKRIRKIEIKTRSLSNNIFAGEYQSAFKGRGMAFSEVREYQIGDDVRSIDWNVTARFSQPFIKVFEEERELTVMLIVDISNSGVFGTKNKLKKDLIAELSAVLSFSATMNNDKIGAILFSNKVEKFIPPKKGRTHILRIIKEILDFEPEGKGTNISEALVYLTNALKKKSTAFVISDFLDFSEKKEVNFFDALRIASQKHDVVAIRVSDPREAEMPSVGLIELYDAETGREQLVDTSSGKIRTAYKAWWLETTDNLKKSFARLRVDSTEIRTDVDYIKPLVQLFKQR